MTKRKIMLITVCFAIFAISLLLSRQFFKSAGKRNMDVPAAGSEQIEDSKDTEEMTELEETERTAASEGAAEPERRASCPPAGRRRSVAADARRRRDRAGCGPRRGIPLSHAPRGVARAVDAGVASRCRERRSWRAQR